MDEYFLAYPFDTSLEEQLEIMHKYLKEIKLKNQDVWCTKCSMAGHTKDNFRQDIHFVQKKCFCNIFQEHGEHTMKYCPYNMKNGKASWCTICEVKSHATVDFHLNLKNRQNYQAVCQTNAVAQNNDNISRGNDQNEPNNQRYEGR